MLVASHDQSLSYTQQDLDFQNDYSNPQQGTSSRRFDPGSPSSRTMNQSVSTTQQYVKNHHDRRSTMQNIIPSTVKDDRKLFVGGLPLDSTSALDFQLPRGCVFLFFLMHVIASVPRLFSLTWSFLAFFFSYVRRVPFLFPAVWIYYGQCCHV
jgi:hypothetical protein